MVGIASDAFVFFGATGDLARRKVFPALQAMTSLGQLDMPVIGVSRGGLSVTALREMAHSALQQEGTLDPVAFERLSMRLQYVDGDYRDPDCYRRLKLSLGDSHRPIFYLAIPPSVFADVIRGLASSGCATGARIIVEKPFGRDLASAQALNRTLHEEFPEESIFRIDHYLGKEAVQNLLYFRFANAFLEPIWNRTYVSEIQVTLAETLGVDGRGALYDEIGTLRDVVQNHLLQVLSLLAMDAPTGRDAGAMRMAKLRLLRATRPLDPAWAVRGQFEGYHAEPGVIPGSNTETCAAVRLYIDTWRWSDVPIYLRAGKRFPVTATEVHVNLRAPPINLFDDETPNRENYFRFRLSPEVVISAGARVKLPGDLMAGESVELVARRQADSGRLPYARLLHDAICGEPALFSDAESVEAAWRIIDPVLGDAVPIARYAPGTWGPAAKMDGLLCGGRWNDPFATESA